VIGSKRALAKGPTVSACMIVKNEEEFLPRCLESIKNLVDELIIVDTGSTDRTVEIAKSYDAKVYYHPWEDDFSKHRNQALSYATKDWIFQIDADEVLAPGCGGAVCEAIKNESIDSVYVTIKSAFDESKGEAVHNFIRIFRRNGVIHYEGRVHNRIVGARASEMYPIMLFHEGYNLSREDNEKKHIRRVRLLEKEIEENPDDPVSYHYLAVAYLGNKLYVKALEECKKALYLAAKYGQEDVLYLWTRFVAAVCCLNTNRIGEAESLCLEAIKSNPMHVDSHYLLSSIYYNQENIQRFMDHSAKYLSLMKRLKTNPREFGLMANNTISHEWRMRLHRGFVFTDLGEKEKADKEYALAMQVCHDKGEYYKQCCLFHVRRSENEQAGRFLQKALEYKPEDKELKEAKVKLHENMEVDEGQRKRWDVVGISEGKVNRPTISLCMMVKNEEDFLAQCLESVNNCVDEIIIVDTGSTDRTVKIAEQYTNKVYFHPWENDFSKHRNQALSYATKDWIFQIDADEVLAPECGEVVREAIKDESIDSVYVTIKSAFDESRGEAVHNFIRIFRRNGVIHYEGRVHNRIVGARESKMYPITLFHEGYNLTPDESRKKFIRTTTLLKKEIEENPQHPRAYHYLASSYLSESMYDEAIDSAIRAITLAEENNYRDFMYLWSHFIAGISYLKTNKLDEAEEVCLKALNKSSIHLDSHYLLTIIYFERENWDKLFHHSTEYFTLLDKSEKTPGVFGPMVHNTISHRWRAYLHRGFAFTELREGEKAKEEYASALNLCNDKGEYYNLLATFHLRRSEFSIAEQHLLEALKHKHDDKGLYQNGVRIYEQLGKREKQITFLNEVLKRDSDDMESAFRLGTIHLEEKSYSQAKDLLQKVIAKDPSHSGALINLGIIAKRTWDLDGALRYLEKALREAPNSVEALSNLGYVYYDKDNLLKAKQVFERLTETDPTLLDIHLMLAMIYVRLEHIEGVVAQCDKILDLLGLDRNITLNSLSDLSNLFIDIGKALSERRRPAMGALAFNVFSHLSGETSENLKRVARMCFEQGLCNASLEFLEKAVRLNPQDWESFRLMGDCYAKMGIEEAAAMSYQKANELNTAAISCNKAPWNNDSPLSQY
jgi:glycosyltransferase involved in cell wall biosynthesis